MHMEQILGSKEINIHCRNYYKKDGASFMLKYIAHSI